MKNIDLIFKQDLFDNIGVKVGQACCYINDDNDFRFYGSITAEDERLDDYLLYIKANFCDDEGRVWYVLDDFCGTDFEMVKYDTFSLYCADLKRFVDIEKLHYVEVYPKVVKKKEEK